ncbi:hypothetical protein QYE76_064024 [Lolium multiflorum]|uniref:Uncharacterized protein n=1 Tax=Lolium multiflorum TaxID=4521 RepID=A0AAD8W9M9_LOLMU|nr:hypothetical protein QYE76_064024 [Lolium multiflorum]
MAGANDGEAGARRLRRCCGPEGTAAASTSERPPAVARHCRNRRRGAESSEEDPDLASLDDIGGGGGSEVPTLEEALRTSRWRRRPAGGRGAGRVVAPAAGGGRDGARGGELSCEEARRAPRGGGSAAWRRRRRARRLARERSAAPCDVAEAMGIRTRSAQEEAVVSVAESQRALAAAVQAVAQASHAPADDGAPAGGGAVWRLRSLQLGLDEADVLSWHRIPCQCSTKCPGKSSAGFTVPPLPPPGA